MSVKYYQVLISAENRKEANKILDVLLQKKLIAGGMISKGPAKFWWKAEIITMAYYNISAFTIKKHKEAIISAVKKVSIEEVPMIWFMAFEGNKELLLWIDENVS